MRGKPPTELEGELTNRITPAHAGKTALYKKGDIVIEDHPRACGENTYFDVEVAK